MKRLTALSHLAALLLTSCGLDPAPEVEVPSWAKVAPEQIAAARKHGVPVAFENDLGMRFVLIPAGAFLMGSPEDEEGRQDDETQHEVTISRPFYMSIYEVTNGQYRQYRPEHDSGEFTGHTMDEDLQPVVNVSWEAAAAHAGHVSRRDGARAYRLPTEGEWERACRAGVTTPYSFGESISTDHANFDGHYGDSGWGSWWRRPTMDVGTLGRNTWGLYDMHGNASEWCKDPYSEKYMRFGPTDPNGQVGEAQRVIRGGSWFSPPVGVRAAHRWRQPPDATAPFTGIRLVSPLPEPGERGR